MDAKTGSYMTTDRSKVVQSRTQQLPCAHATGPEQRYISTRRAAVARPFQVLPRAVFQLTGCFSTKMSAFAEFSTAVAGSVNFTFSHTVSMGFILLLCFPKLLCLNSCILMTFCTYVSIDGCYRLIKLPQCLQAYFK